MREVAHQLHAHRAGRGDGEGLFHANAAVFRTHFLCHNFCHNFFLSQNHCNKTPIQTEKQVPSRYVKIQALS